MKPSQLWPGYEFNGAVLSIPIQRIDGLTPDEAHPTMGDFRALMFSLCSTLQTHMNKLPSRPVGLRALGVSEVGSSMAEGAVKRTYSYEFTDQTLLEGPDVIPEPT